jgi:hypothetical protein
LSNLGFFPNHPRRKKSESRPLGGFAFLGRGLSNSTRKPLNRRGSHHGVFRTYAQTYAYPGATLVDSRARDAFGNVRIRLASTRARCLRIPAAAV